MTNLLSSELLLPRYNTVLPFSGEEVSFTPFRVKDAKHIAIILQEENKKLAFTTMVELLKQNSDVKNILDLCVADLEFLFLQIRAKSVDEQLNLIYNKEKITVNIYDIKNKNSISSIQIPVNNDTHIVLETPTAKDLFKLDNFTKETLIKSCIKKIIVKNEIYHVNKYVTKELNEIIDNLPLFVVPKIEDFLGKQPELYIILETKDGPKEVSGFLSFFTSR